MSANENEKVAVGTESGRPTPAAPVQAQAPAAVAIVNEEGEKEQGEFEVTKQKTDKKNVVEVTNKDTGEVRSINKDRIVKTKPAVPAAKSEKKVQKAAPKAAAPAKKKKKLEKFDVATLKGAGVLFRYHKIKRHNGTTSNMNVEAFCLVSSDGKKWRYFNLYNGSLGKKSKVPALTDKDKITNEDIAGNMKSVEEYLKTKEYIRV